MFETILDARYWRAVPFHFWSAVFFVLGSMVGSFLNVCIYRMPIGQSIVSPPSHCPNCKYSIPWYLNIPLVTWLYLRGKCGHCGAPISPRYFLVELLTAVLFLGAWLAFGGHSAGLVICYCVLMSGLIVATFIDFEHFIIPDEITLGGAAVGFVCSLLVPALHGAPSVIVSLQRSAFGIGVGAALIYTILRLGKLFLGRQKLALQPDTRVVFTESAVVLPDKTVPYEDVFYRESDVISLKARTVEMIDRCYRDVVVRLSPGTLRIDDERFDPEKVPHLEVVSGQIVLPREAMGLGDVKFMAAIGAFLGWKAVVFSLLVSSFIGAAVGITLVLLHKRALSSRLPYGPYIAAAAVIWIFAGPDVVAWYRDLITPAGLVPVAPGAPFPP